MTNPVIIKIGVQYVGAVKHHIETLIKKANRLGVSFPNVEFSKPYGKEVRTFENGVDRKKTIWYVDVTLTGEGIDRPVSYGGWEILGAFNHEYKTGVIANILSPDVDPSFRQGFEHKNTSVCMHCNHKRYRNNSYAIREIETGKQLLVGSSCMSDYVPNKKSPQDVIAYYQSVREEFSTMDWEECGGGFTRYDAVEPFLTRCAAVYLAQVVHYRDEAFLAIVLNPVSPDEKPSEKSLAIKAKFPEARDAFPRIMEFVEGLDDNNDFDLKIKRIAMNGYFNPKDARVLAWAVFKYFINLEKQKQLETDNNEFIGQVGGVIEVDAEFIGGVYFASSDYGDIMIYRFKTQEGNTITWKTSPRDIEKGQYHIKARIKEHTEFNGIKQTVITRPRIS